MFDNKYSPELVHVAFKIAFRSSLYFRMKLEHRRDAILYITETLCESEKTEEKKCNIV